MVGASRQSTKLGGAVDAILPALLSTALLASLTACSSPNRVVEVADVERRTESTPAEYQAELTAADATIAAAMDAVEAAGSLEALEFALELSETAVTGVTVRLGVLPSPPEARLTHLRLLPGLRSLAQGFAQVGQEVTTRQICAAPAAMARISGLNSVVGLRTVQAAFASNSAGSSYQFGASLPQPRELPNRQPPNGTVVLDQRDQRGQRGTGDGSFEISNSGDLAAVVTLADGDLVGGDLAVASVYVADGQTATLDRIASATYSVYFTTGVDWDPRLQTFTRDCQFVRFDQPFDFAATRNRTVELQMPLPNLTTTEVDPADYLDSHYPGGLP